MASSAPALANTAAELFVQGFQVFPTRGKVPAVAKGQDWRTIGFDDCDWASADGIGLAVPEGMIVVDVDMKKGDGFVELAERYPDLWSCGAPIVRTPSGGFHIYLTTERGEDILLSQRGLSPNVDVRCGGFGYVVAAGSPGYDLIAGDLSVPIPAPRALLEAIRKVEVTTEARPAQDGGLRGLALAANYLLANPPTGRQEDGRRFAIACRLHGFGISQDAAREMMHRWNEDSEHPRAPEEIEKAITNGWKHARGEPGAELPPDFNELFGEGDGEEVEPPLHVLSGEDIWADMPALAVVVPGLLAQGDHYVDAAPPSSAKTYRSIDFGLSAAFGRKWCGQHDVTPARPSVAFLAFEDWRGVRERIVTWAKHEGVAPGDALGKVHILRDMQASLVYDADVILGKIAQIQPGVLVVSTFADAMEGMDTMSEKDVRSCYVRFVREVRKRCPGIVVYSEAHQGKSNGDVLASQALRASADLMTLSRLDPKTGDTFVTLTKAPKHFARPSDDVILAASSETVMIQIDGEIKTNLVYRKPALRIVKEEQEADAGIRKWEALVQAHHIDCPPDRDTVQIDQASLFKRAGALQNPPITGKAVENWYYAQLKAAGPTVGRYLSTYTDHSEGKNGKRRFWVYAERLRNTNLEYILNGSDTNAD